MPDDPGLIDLETTILLLPTISRGAHLDGPILHAQNLIELWKLDSPSDAVPLTLAFRLLDVEAVARAVYRAAAAKDYSSRPWDWDLPGAEALLSELRAIVWAAMLAGTLITEAIKGVRGNRYRVVLLAELPRLTPDWELSRLTLDGRDEFIEVRIRHAPAEPVKKTWRKPVTEAELKEAAEKVARTYPAGAHPSFREFWDKLKKDLPRATRNDAHNALTNYAPQLRGRRGYRSTRSPS